MAPMRGGVSKIEMRDANVTCDEACTRKRYNRGDVPVAERSGSQSHLCGQAISELSEHVVHDGDGVVVISRGPTAPTGFAHAPIGGVLAGRASHPQCLPVRSDDH